MLISNKYLRFLFTLFLTTIALCGFANATPEGTAANGLETTGTEVKPVDQKTKVKDFINHHLLDSHSFNFNANEDTKEHYGFALPIILWDGGLQFFMSSKFHHENEAVEHNGNYYVLHHEKIYKTDASGKLIFEHEHPTNVRPLDLSITKSVIGLLFIAFFMFFAFSKLAGSYAINGGIAKGTTRILEPLILYIRDEMAIPNIGEKNYRKYMSYLLTVFFFIFFLNLLGLTPMGFNITGNIAVTFSLALITYLITTFSANKHYWSHMLWMPGVPLPLKPFLALIELLGTVIKPFSLMIRLYANMLAGHVVLMSIIALMFFFKSWIGSPLSLALAFFLSILEILVAFLQAYIFTMLTSLYFGAANEEHHHEEAHH